MTVSRTASSPALSAPKRPKLPVHPQLPVRPKHPKHPKYPKGRVIALAGAAALTLGALAVAPGAAASPDTAGAAVPGGCAYTAASDRPVLRAGSSGAAVKQAQCLSNVWGGLVPKLDVDGKFGDATRAKVRWIQGCHGLPEDGVIGARTWEALYYPVPDCYDPYPG